MEKFISVGLEKFRACLFVFLFSVFKHFFYFFVSGNKKGTETHLLRFCSFFVLLFPETKMEQK